MIKNFFHNLLLRRHFWRYATFSEVAELYMSRMLRMAAMHIVGSFISIYLFQLGYSIVQIALYWAASYFFKVIITLPTASFIGWVGPKHAILFSNLLYIPSMICFALIPEYGFWLLIPTLVMQGWSSIMYSIAYSIDFSKVKSVKHAGKEIGYMNIIEKCTTGISPLIGGALAFWVGPQVIIGISAVLFALASIPLLRTGEHVKTRVKLRFQAFPWRLFFHQAWAQTSIGFDIFVTGTAWSLYMAVFIIGLTDDNAVYAISGALMSVVFFAALVASYAFGRIIDRRRGKELMQFGVIAKAVIHLFRPFVATPVSAAGINATSEIASTAYAMPNTRATFDNADMSGTRTTYIGLVELVANIGAGLAALLLAGLATIVGNHDGYKIFFLLSGGVVLLILTARFPLYKK